MAIQTVSSPAADVDGAGRRAGTQTAGERALDLCTAGFDVDYAALVVDGGLSARRGPAHLDAQALSAVGSGRRRLVLDARHWAAVHLSSATVGRSGTLVVARGETAFDDHDLEALEAAAWLVEAALDGQRAVRALHEQQALLARLIRIQRSIALRAPLHDVFDVITAGAAELTGDDIVSLRLIDPDHPSASRLQAAIGLSDHERDQVAALAVSGGASGLAMRHNGLAVIEDYPSSPRAHPALAAAGVQAAMAAPVHENGRVIGSLVVATRRPGRRYGAVEGQLLLTFAEHASLAVTDARMMEALRAAVDDSLRLALHDPLTGLANRTRYLDRLRHAVNHDRRADQLAAVVLVDLDDFARVNDRHGHRVGDDLLKAVANRIRQAVRSMDTVARLSGDEFAVLVEDVSGAADATAAAEALQRAVASVALPDGSPLTASVGVAVAEPGRDGAEVAMRNADVALAQAKAAGHGRTVVFETSMYERLMERLELEEDLRRAVARDEIALHFQPVVTLPEGQVVGAEALARWHHPARGWVPAPRFIAVAEETGLIVPLGRQLLRAACQQAARWQSAGAGHTPLTVSVNLSGRQLQDPGLVATVEGALAEAGLAPGSLVLEITESVLIHDAEGVADQLAALRGLGVRLALDDFGTGFSSLSYLLRLPVDTLKMDRCFVASVGRDQDHRRLAAAIVTLAESLGLHCVAEGVEEQSQAEELAAMGCRRAQGYLYGRPVPAADFEAQLRRPNDGTNRPRAGDRCAISGYGEAH